MFNSTNIELGWFIFQPDRYVIAYRLFLGPGAREASGVLASILEVFKENRVPLVHVYMSRPLPERVIELVLFADLTFKNELVDRIKARLKELDFVEKVEVFQPELNGLISISGIRLSLLGERVVVFRRPLYEAFIKRLREKAGVGYMAILYHIGFEMGRTFYEEVVNMTEEQRAMLSIASKLFEQLGMGSAEIVEFNQWLKKAVIRVYDCFECDLFKGSGKPESHLVRGFIAGFSKEFFGNEVNVEEVKCIATGDEYCEFRVSPRTE